MPDFSSRATDQEVMDDLQSSGEVLNQALRELDTINELLGGNYVTINGISQLLNGTRVNDVHIADLGCGGGEMLRLILKWAERKSQKVTLIGVDANASVVEFARKHTKKNQHIEFEAIDIFSEAFKAKSFDIVTGTLFFHHFTTEELITFFRQLKKQTRIGLVINDIHRHWAAYHSIQWLTKLFSKSSMVKNDAPLSVLRAFKRSELRFILDQAGFTNYSIRWMWAFRWQVIARLA